MPLKLIAPKAGRTPNWTIRGTYLGRYVDRSSGTSDRRVAARLLAEVKAGIERDAISGTKPTGKDFVTAATEYMHATGATRFMTPLLQYFKGVDIASIDQAAIEAAAATILPKASAATRNRQVYTPVSAVMRHAKIRIDLRRPKGAQGREVVHWLWPEQAEKLIKAARQVHKELPCLIALALSTGMRRSEMLGLEIEDIRLPESYLLIRKTKNGQPRAVHLPPTAVAALANHPNLKKREGKLFSFHIGSGLYGPLREAYAAAGLETGGQPLHILRHTYATWMRRYGGIDDIGLLQTGAWKDPKSVRRYAHAVVSEEARRADLLPITGKFGGRKVKALK